MKKINLPNIAGYLIGLLLISFVVYSVAALLGGFSDLKVSDTSTANTVTQFGSTVTNEVRDSNKSVSEELKSLATEINESSANQYEDDFLTVFSRINGVTAGVTGLSVSQSGSFSTALTSLSSLITLGNEELITLEAITAALGSSGGKTIFGLLNDMDADLASLLAGSSSELSALSTISSALGTSGSNTIFGLLGELDTNTDGLIVVAGSILTGVTDIEALIGTSSDGSSVSTVFGRLQKLEDKVDAIDTSDDIVSRDVLVLDVDEIFYGMAQRGDLDRTNITFGNIRDDKTVASFTATSSQIEFVENVGRLEARDSAKTTLVYEARIYFSALDTASTSRIFQVGLNKRNSGLPTSDGAVIYMDSAYSGNSNFWVFTRYGSTTVAADSGVAATTGTWYTFKIKYGASDTKFYINDVLVYTDSKNIPSLGLPGIYQGDATIEADYMKIYWE